MRLAAPFLPAVVDWPTRDAHERALAADAHGPADWVVVGSSVVRTGVVPSVVEETAGQQIEVFNAGLAGAGGESIAAWTRGVVLPHLEPQRLVIGLSGIELNEGNPLAREHVESMRRSVGWRRAVVPSFVDRVERRLAGMSVFWRDRQVLRRPLGLARSLGDDRQAVVGPDGVLLALAEYDAPIPDHVQARGFADWDLQGQQTQEVRSLIETAQSRCIDVVLVVFPVADDAWERLAAGQNTDAEAFDATVRRLASSHGTPLIDLSDAIPASQFRDPLHLSRAGRDQLSLSLGHQLASLPTETGGCSEGVGP